MSENNPLDEVFGEFSTPQRRRRRTRVSGDVPETEAPKPREEAPVEETPVVVAPVAEEPEVEEPEVVEPEVIEPEVIEPEVVEETPVMVDEPVEPQRRRRRRNPAPDDGAAKVEATAVDPTETPVEAQTATERRFAFGKKPTEDAPREFGSRFGASSRAAAKGSDTTTEMPVEESKPAPTGWGARFAKSGTATAAPKSSGSDSRLGGLGTRRAGATPTTTTASRPTTTTTSRPTTRARSTGFTGVVQGFLKFIYTAAFVIAFLASVFGPFVSFAHVTVYPYVDGDFYSTEVGLIDYFIGSEYSLLSVFIDSFANIGDKPGELFYSLMIGIPSIIFLVGYIKRIIAGIKGIFTWNSHTLAGVVIGGVRSTLMITFMHILAGSSSAATDMTSSDSYIAYSYGEGFVAGFSISIAIIILAYILTFFMQDRNLMYKREEVASVARVVTYFITLSLIFTIDGVDIINAMMETLEDFNPLAIAVSITLLVMFVRLYKTAANGLAVNMACLHNTGESFGERMTADSNPKTSVMKHIFINAGVSFGAIILLDEILEIGSLFSMCEMLVPILVIAGICAIICKVCKVK